MMKNQDLMFFIVHVFFKKQNRKDFLFLFRINLNQYEIYQEILKMRPNQDITFTCLKAKQKLTISPALLSCYKIIF